MADAKAELEELRRLDELERRAAPAAPAQTPAAQPAPKKFKRLFGGEVEMTPELQESLNYTKLKPWGSGIPALADDVGGRVTDLTGSPVAGYVSNVATQALPALLGSFRIPSAPGQSITAPLAERLMSSAVKPSQADRQSGAAAKAIKTMLDEGINPTTGGMDKASKITRGLDAEVEGAIKASPETVSVAGIGQRLRAAYDKARMQVNPKEDVDAVRAVWDKFRNSPNVQGNAEIPVQLAQALKKGTYESLGGKAYGEVGSVSTEAQKALARGMRETVMEKVPQIAEPLKRQASIMNVKDVALNAVTRDANKDILGLAGLASNPYMGAATLADRWGALKAFGAQGLYTAGKPSVALPIGITADQAIQTDKQRLAEYLKKIAAEQGAQQ